MATKTSLLGLTKPAYTEAADIAVLNTNFDLIDKAVGNGKSVRQELDNSDFMPGRVVNQRGFTSTNFDTVYTVDRWMANSSNNASTISIGSGGITLVPTATDYAGILQRLENYAAMSGKVYTLGVCINGAWETATFTMAAAVGGAGFPSGLRVYSTGGFHILIRNMPGQSPITIQRVALYEGTYTAETLPAYVYKGYAVELAECMRYYQQSFASNSVTNGLGVGVLIQIGTTSNCLQTVEYRVPMRIIPTVTIYSPAGTKNAVWNWQSDMDVGTNVVAAYASVYGFTPVQAQAFEKGIPYAFHYTASADL